MISNEKMEEHWMRYKSEGVAKGLSMQAFCSMHNIPYNAFEKYLKLRRHFSAAHPVKIVGMPDDEKAMDTAFSSDKPEQKNQPSATSSTPADNSRTKIRIMIDIRMTNGVNIRQKNLDYPGLVSFVKKIETLC